MTKDRIDELWREACGCSQAATTRDFVRPFAHRVGTEYAAAERERLRLLFDAALADNGVCWPGEVDILRNVMFRDDAAKESKK